MVDSLLVTTSPTSVLDIRTVYVVHSLLVNTSPTSVFDIIMECMS